jgi:hypothetical protein
MYLFARNEEANQWLAENPLVLGGGSIVLGLILIGLGVYALITKRAPTKRGPDLEGGHAMAMAIVWLVVGGLFLLFGAFKIVSGLLS